ncbi:MAG: methionine--tRNA ligase [Candidatus Nealsonbacteria bacterium CG08_land_8_20_14_0_20_38_20]|uniref:Methionine--tRNA ligase n=1 Tax=Candidatus Nealsonbacteria bacterium CG08_land_8_20_14_0_20_38_20 TaxID=1974705 RepID=A0A2H0YLA0_9BACT|nr:MAG: methionine--tRNA ligase [Candidatus Nealsonbacteria bacterium CG08_land_8_20_14_0_20_38_20]
MKKFYITTTLPYVNADPHIGFALEIIQADVVARCRRQKGDEVFFNTGTDEHGLKIYRKALEENKDPQKYCDEYAAKFDDLKKALNLSYNNFIRTTDKIHIKAAQEFWQRCKANRDIYKEKYKMKYCVGCELEKTESELQNGKCPTHPNLDLEIIEEENYFFRYSRYQDKLLKLYEKKTDFVLPISRLNEIKKFTKRGLKDFSISRLKEKMPWGVSVPGDENHVMYVWFDALVNYISCLGWPKDLEKFNQYWPGVQIAGKDNLRQQSSMWQAMLMSAGLPNSKQILIHGFITSGGQKMSKSLGNVIDPFVLVKKYGTDAVRYFFLREIPPTEDGDFTFEKFETRYNSDLANGLGNLVARVVTLAKIFNFQFSIFNKFSNSNFQKVVNKTWKDWKKSLDEFKFNEALISIWDLISFCDKYIEKERPWETKNQKVINNLLFALENIAEFLKPFLPETSEKILKQIKKRKNEPLFPRI